MKQHTVLIISLFLLLFLGTMPLVAQTSIDPSAVLEITSTDQGMVFPQMTTEQRDAIDAPAQRLIIYNTTMEELNVYIGSTWYNGNFTKRITADEISSATSTKTLHFAPVDIKELIYSIINSSKIRPELTQSASETILGVDSTIFELTGENFQMGMKFIDLPDNFTQQVTIHNPSSATVAVTSLSTEEEEDLSVTLNFNGHAEWDNAPTVHLHHVTRIPLLENTIIKTGNYYKFVSATPFGPDLLTNYTKDNLNYLESAYRAIGNDVVTSDDVKAYGPLFEKPDFTALEFPVPYSFLLTNANNDRGDQGPTLEEMVGYYSSQLFFNSDHLSTPHGDGFQVLTIQRTGSYRVTAWGATGSDADGRFSGEAENSDQLIEDVGSAAKVSNVFTLAAGTQIVAAVGQKGYKFNHNSNDGVSGVTGGSTFVGIIPPGQSFATYQTEASLMAGGGPAQGDADESTDYKGFGQKSTLRSTSSEFSSLSALVGYTLTEHGETGASGWGSFGYGVASREPRDSPQLSSYNGGGANATFSNTRVSESNPNPDPHNGAVLIELLID